MTHSEFSNQIEATRIMERTFAQVPAVAARACEDQLTEAGGAQ